ncbi:hypothetical protein V6N11_071567 [Hibiscus sabdariffa]|uniref:Uncharacterized protein n=1 Tax=Hibiscus sabdariffa TaxID=183260 RepID=A0ABR2U0U3_9ROSI
MEGVYPFNRTDSVHGSSEPDPAQLMEQPNPQVRGPAPLSPAVRSNNKEKQRWAPLLLADLVGRKKEMGSSPMRPSSL